MTTSKLTTEEIKSGLRDPLLIVDRGGLIGRELILKLGKDTQIVIVSRQMPDLPGEFSRNVLCAPFSKKIPSVPDGKYSAIFIIDDSLADLKNLLGSFYKKAESDKTPVVYASPLEISNEGLIKEIQNKYSNLKVLVYGDIFDNDLYSDPNALINKFLHQAFFYGKVEVPGDGTMLTYPIHLDDLVSSLLEVVYGNHDGKLFYAFPKHAPTSLAIVRAITKADPDIKIDFISQAQVSIDPPKMTGTFILGENYSVGEKIKTIVHDNSGKSFELAGARKKEKVRGLSRNFPIDSFIVSVIFFLVLPFLATFSLSVLGTLNLWQARLAFENGNMHFAGFFLKTAKESFSASRATFELLSLEASVLGLSNEARVVGANIDAGKDISKALFAGVDVYQKFSNVFSGKSINPSRDFSDANVELSDALVLIKKTEANRDVLEGIRKQIGEENELLRLASSFQSILPEVIGVDGKRSYLVLFQNNMELRPTGGFIGSYGILSLNNGKVSDFTISDVYDADGQLKGHVEPPFPIRRYLPSVHWYLRDSNFDLEFPKAASQSAFFLKVEKNQTVDGVLAVDVSFAKKLLRDLGSVHVPEYNQEVTSSNFFSLAVVHSEKNFFPGSTQKKDFLSAVFRAIKSKILDKKISYVALFKTVGSGLVEKNILLSSLNPNVQKLFSVNGWSSSLWDQRTATDKNISDFLAINEANLGVNKVNYLMERKVSKNTTISNDGRISTELDISFKNNSDGSWPGGAYKNYLRIVLPLGTKISSIDIDKISQNIFSVVSDPLVYEGKNFTPPSGLEVENYQENGKEVFGILLEVPPKSSKEIVISYTLSLQVSIKSPLLTYNLAVVKQPGVDYLPFNTSISYPSSLSVVSSPGFSKQNESIVFKKDIVSDTEISASFAAK